MNQVLGSKKQHNEMLEEELRALKEGKRRGDGPNGLQALQEFESLLMAIPIEESKILNPDKTAEENVGGVKGKAQLGKQGKQPGNFTAAPSTDKPMAFLQNLKRNEDLNKAEKHMVNMVAQDYDAIKMLGTFDTQTEHQDLMAFKNNQHKDMSYLRAEGQKVLLKEGTTKHLQDFQNFGLQQEVESKRKEYAEMVERMMVMKQLQELSQMPRQPVYIPQQPVYYQALGTPENQDPRKSYQEQPANAFMNFDDKISEKSLAIQDPKDSSFAQTVKSGFSIQASEMISTTEETSNNNEDKDYLLNQGFDVYFDYITHLFQNFESARLVFTVQNTTDLVIEPILIEEAFSLMDPTNEDMRFVPFFQQNVLKYIKPHFSCNLIIEVQVPRMQGEKKTWIAYGWTVLNIFNPQRKLNAGVWKLPLYQSPLNAQIDFRDMWQLKLVPSTIICIRIANGRMFYDDEIKQHDPVNAENPNVYLIPDIHTNRDRYKPDGSDIEELDNEDDSDENQDLKKEKEKAESEEDFSVRDDVDAQKKYENHGLIIKIHHIMNYGPPSSTFVVATLFQGSDIIKTLDSVECEFKTHQQDFSQVKELETFVPNDKSIGRYIFFGDQTFWRQDFYKIWKNGTDKREMHLVLEIYETWIDNIDLDADNASENSARSFLNKFNEIEQRSRERLFGYSSIVINNTDGTMKYGIFDLNIFKPPINLFRKSSKDLISDKSVKITLQMPEHKDFEEMEEQEKKEVLQQRVKKQEELAKVVPYLESSVQQFDKKNVYVQGNGIDFYIDQARYLPDGVTVSRLLIRGIKTNHEKIFASTKAYPDFGASTKQIQVFDYRIELRPENKINGGDVIDKMTYMEIMIETIDRSDMKEKIVGYAYFPLFVNNMGIPFQHDVDQEQASYNFKQGCYQLPVFSQRVNQKTAFTMDAIDQLPKIGACSILVRSYRCAIERNKNLNLENFTNLTEEQLIAKKIIREAPSQYSQGKYNTEMCKTTEEVLTIYKFKHKRINPIMNQTLAYLFERKGLKLDSHMEVKQIIMELEEIFGKVSLSKQKMLSRFENSYEPKYGYKVSVTRLHGLPASQKTRVHYIVSQYVPPGRLMRVDPQFGPDVHVFKDQDFNSPWNSIAFTDKMNYIGLPANEKVGMVFEVKCFDPGMNRNKVGDSIQHVGWTFFPVFVTVENENQTFSIFTNAGLAQLPLFRGKVNKKKLIQALNTENPLFTLQRDRELQYMEGTSILVRLHDNQQLKETHQQDYSNIDSSFLPTESSEKYMFSLEQLKKSKNTSVTENISFIDNVLLNEYTKICLKQEYGFNYPKIQ